MRMFEVGFVCEVEGGHGELLSRHGNLLENIRSVLIRQARDIANEWDVDFDDDDTYADCSDYKFCEEYKAAAEKALVELKNANSIDELREVRVGRLHLKALVMEREILELKVCIKLTQAVFNGAPDWVRSAATNKNGRSYLYPVQKSDLEHANGYWHMEHGGYSPFCGEHDATDWENSAIDRDKSA